VPHRSLFSDLRAMAGEVVVNSGKPFSGKGLRTDTCHLDGNDNVGKAMIR